jgi:hypothetical protein
MTEDTHVSSCRKRLTLYLAEVQTHTVSTTPAMKEFINNYDSFEYPDLVKDEYLSWYTGGRY